MDVKRLGLSLAILLAVVAPAWAQSPHPRESLKPDERKKAADELDARAMDLLNEVIRDLGGLRSPENRIPLLATVAETLWKRDEKRARALFDEAAKGLGELLGELQSDDDQFEQKTQRLFELRHQLLQKASHLDPALALDFLNATRNPAHATPMYPGQPDMETTLRLRLAAETVERDPKMSLEIAEKVLENGLSYEINNIAQQLYYKDKQLCERLVALIIERLRAEDLAANQMAAYIASGLLGMAIEGKREAERQAESRESAGSDPFRLSSRATSELMGMAVKAAMGIASGNDFLQRLQSGYGQTIFNLLQGMRAEVEKYSPPDARMLASKLDEYKKLTGAMGHYTNDDSSMSVDDYLMTIEDAPAETRQGLYQQAAIRAMNADDPERARQIANEKITNPRNRREILSQVRHILFSRALNDGKIEEARGMIPLSLPKEERASMLARLAMTASGNGDKQTALRLINEAQSLVSSAAESYGQMGVHLDIALASYTFDPGKSFDIIEQNIDRFNQLIAAAAILEGFEIRQYFNEGEFVPGRGNQLTNMLNQYWVRLGMLARTDFERARRASDRFQPFEAQIMARLHVARTVLSQRLDED
jgi:hypothetical protein